MLCGCVVHRWWPEGKRTTGCRGSASRSGATTPRCTGDETIAILRSLCCCILAQCRRRNILSTHHEGPLLLSCVFTVPVISLLKSTLCTAGSGTCGLCTRCTTGGGTRAWPSTGPCRASTAPATSTAWTPPRWRWAGASTRWRCSGLSSTGTQLLKFPTVGHRSGCAGFRPKLQLLSPLSDLLPLTCWLYSTNRYTPFSAGSPLEVVNCLSPPAKGYEFPKDLYHF
jgi:hypothetical protein